MKLATRHAATFLMLAMYSCGGGSTPPTPRPLDWTQASDDHSLPYLEPPLSIEETRDLRAGFAWASTVPLSETDPDGNPSLYYAMVYVTDREQLELLDLLSIPSQTLPLFAEERTRWAGQVGVLHNRGDYEGLFRFAVVPGVIYNALREQALAGDAPFDAIVLRDAPVPEAEAPDGTLSYAFLAERGFRYSVGTSETTEGGASSPLILELIALVVSSRDVRDGVDDALSAIDRAVRGEAHITTWLEVFNTDFDFGNGFDSFDRAARMPNPSRLRRMQRAWGSGRGDELRVPGVEVVAQSALGVVREYADRSGQVTLKVADGQEYDICVRLENHAAGIGESFHSLQICEFGVDAATEGLVATEDAPIVQPIRVSDWRTNVLAQMTDAHEYTDEVFDHRIGRGARVLVGPAADLIGLINENRANTVCGGFNSVGILHLAPVVIGLVPAAIAQAQASGVPIPPGIAELASPIIAALIIQAFTNDIVFPNSNESNDSLTSRIVATHEYGHYVMCDLIARQSADDFTEAIGDLTYTVLFAEERQTPEQSNLVFTEAWADFFTSQVAGATNYVSFPSAETPDTNGLRTGAARGYFCKPTAEWCLEDNVGGLTQRSPSGTPFDDSVARMVTLLHDAFDGPASASGTGDQPIQRGQYWTLTPSDTGLPLFELTGGGQATEDEEVALPGSAIRDLWRQWAAHYSTVSERSIATSLARVVRDAGYSETQTCDLFALHTRTGDCLDLIDVGGLELRGVEPRAPRITSTLVHETDLEFLFVDYSPRGTSFRWILEGEDGSLRNGTLPYARSQTLTVPGLTQNTRYTLHLQTLNDGYEGPEALDERVTLAERVASVSATPGRARAELTWGAVRAERYEVVEERTGSPDRSVGNTLRTRLTLTGLPAAPITFRVYAVNKAGIRAEGSPAVVVTPMEPNVVYVSTFGNDSSPTAGQQSTPYRSCDAALTAARAAVNVDSVYFEQGTYVCSEAHRVMQDLTLEGGFSRGTWMRGASTTLLAFTGAGFDLPACSVAPRFNAPTRRSDANLAIAPDRNVLLRDITLARPDGAPVRAGNCGVVVHTEGGHLRLENAVIANETFDERCGVGVQGTTSGGSRPSIEIVDSDVTGGPSPTTGLAVSEAAAVCATDATRVLIDGSSLTGRSSFTATRGRDLVSLHGVALRDVDDLRITRSVVRAASRGTSAVSAVNAGFLSSLYVDGVQSLLVDNSVFVTPEGGDQNAVIDIADVSSSAFFYHVTAYAGLNWANDAAGIGPFEGSVLRLRGNLDSATIGLINNLFAYAGGDDRSASMVHGAIDRRDAFDPRVLRMEGNVLSDTLVGGTAGAVGLVLCGTTEFERIVTESALNTTSENDCVAPASTSGWTVRSNRGLTIYMQPGSCSCPVGGSDLCACNEMQFCRFPGTCEPRHESLVVTIEPATHRPSFSSRLPVFVEGGVPLVGMPHAGLVTTTLDGATRATDSSTGAGALMR